MSEPQRIENVGKLANMVRQKAPKKRAVAHNTGPQDEAVERPPVVLRTFPVCWAFPMDEIVFTKWVTNLLTIRIMPWDDLITIQDTYLPDARNKLHDQFLEHTNTDWLVMLDSDVLPPPDFVDRLIRRAKRNDSIDMIGGWYRKKGEPFEPVVYHHVQQNDDGTHQYRVYHENEIGDGVERVDGAGAGCWVMHRKVAEDLGESPYSMDEGGEDLALCRKVHELGYGTYIDWSVACAHAGVGIA